MDSINNHNDYFQESSLRIPTDGYEQEYQNDKDDNLQPSRSLHIQREKPKKKSWFYYEEKLKLQEKQEYEYLQNKITREQQLHELRPNSCQNPRKLLKMDLLEFCKEHQKKQKQQKLKRFAQNIKNLVVYSHDNRQNKQGLSKRRKNQDGTISKLEVSSIPQASNNVVKLQHKKSKSYTTNLLDLLRENKILSSNTKIPSLSSKQSNSPSNSQSNDNQQSFRKSYKELLQEMKPLKITRKKEKEQQELAFRKRYQHDLLQTLNKNKHNLNTNNNNNNNSSIKSIKKLKLQDSLKSLKDSPLFINFDLLCDELKQDSFINFIGETPISQGESTLQNIQKLLNKQNFEFKSFKQDGFSNEIANTFGNIATPTKRSCSSNPTPGFNKCSVTNLDDKFETSVLINQYTIHQQLGKGVIGKTFIASKLDKELFAVKILKKSKIKNSFLNNQNEFHHQIATLKQIEHPILIKLCEVIEDPKEAKYYFVFDFLDKGVVLTERSNKSQNDKFLNNNENSPQIMTESNTWKYFRQILAGLDFLHNEVDISHGSIKPENILIDSNDNFKLSDTGLAQMIEFSDQQLFYLPPEALLQKHTLKKSQDIWACGITIYYLLSGYFPFNSRDRENLQHQICHQNPTMPPHISEELEDFIASCLCKDPKHRPNIQELIVSLNFYQIIFRNTRGQPRKVNGHY